MGFQGLVWRRFVLAFNAAGMLGLSACLMSGGGVTGRDSVGQQNDSSGSYHPIPLADDLEGGAINGATLRSNVLKAAHLKSTATPSSTFGPVTGLVKMGIGEYNTGLLMDDGKIYLATGNESPTVAPLAVPAGTFFIDYEGSMHSSLGLDNTGHVWTRGDASLGRSGSGSDSTAPSDPYKILTDATGGDFTGVVSVTAGGDNNGAVKSDGTVWVWGNCAAGLAGDGTVGGVKNRPTQVPFPAGIKIKKIGFGASVGVALATDGSVWTWGAAADPSYFATPKLGRNTANGTTPGKLPNLPPNIVDISAGGGFYYALTSDGRLYGWGMYSGNLGLPDTVSAATPIPLDPYLALPNPVKVISSNDHTSHAILTDGTLWGWGDDAMGEVGDGQELDYTGPGKGFAWDWGVNDLLIRKPVHIAKEISNWKAVYGTVALTFYVYAVTEDGKLYSWGRNKQGNLLAGVVPAAPVYGQISAIFPNSWDVLVPTQVNPFEQTTAVQKTSPFCVYNPTVPPCDQFNNATGKAVYQK